MKLACKYRSRSSPLFGTVLGVSFAVFLMVFQGSLKPVFAASIQAYRMQRSEHLDHCERSAGFEFGLHRTG